MNISFRKISDIKNVLKNMGGNRIRLIIRYGGAGNSWWYANLKSYKQDLRAWNTRRGDQGDVSDTIRDQVVGALERAGWVHMTAPGDADDPDEPDTYVEGYELGREHLPNTDVIMREFGGKAGVHESPDEVVFMISNRFFK